MRFCLPHWNLLKQALADRNLMQFVAGSGEKLTVKINNEIRGVPDGIEVFDPLWSANMAIWSNAFTMGGQYLLTPDANGQPRCPLCESAAYGGPPIEWWISNAADEQLKRARDLKLLPQEQPS